MSKIKDFLKSPLGTALCAAAACLLAVVLVWLAAVRPNNDKSLSERISDDYSQYSAELDEANGAAQTFDTDNDLLAMAFVFGTSNGQPTGELHLELADADTGEVLARSTGDMANIVARAVHRHGAGYPRDRQRRPPLPRDPETGVYRFRPVDRGLQQRRCAVERYLYRKRRGRGRHAGAAGDLQTDWRIFDPVLLLVGCWPALWCSLAFILPCGAACPLHRLVFVLVLCFGMLYSFVLPPYAAPDEKYHINQSFTLACKWANMFSPDEWRMGNVPLDMTYRREHDFDSLLQNEKTTVFSWQELSENLFTTTPDSFDSHTALEELQTDRNPTLYLFSAAAVFLAYVFHLGFVPALMLGRTANLIVFALLAALAVKAAPFGRRVFAAAALLPMTLHLAASFSRDSLLLGLAFAFTALCMQAIFGCKDGTVLPVRLWLPLAVFGILLAPAKLVYLPLAALFLLIPNSRFGQSAATKKAAYLAGCVLLALSINRAVLVTSVAGSAGFENQTTQTETTSAQGSTPAAAVSYTATEAADNRTLHAAPAAGDGKTSNRFANMPAEYRENTASNFVRRLYYCVEGVTEIPQKELEFWVQALQEGDVTAAVLGQSFFFSPEEVEHSSLTDDEFMSAASLVYLDRDLMTTDAEMCRERLANADRRDFFKSMFSSDECAELLSACQIYPGVEDDCYPLDRNVLIKEIEAVRTVRDSPEHPQRGRPDHLYPRLHSAQSARRGYAAGTQRGAGCRQLGARPCGRQLKLQLAGPGLVLGVGALPAAVVCRRSGAGCSRAGAAPGALPGVVCAGRAAVRRVGLCRLPCVDPDLLPDRLRLPGAVSSARAAVVPAYLPAPPGPGCQRQTVRLHPGLLPVRSQRRGIAERHACGDCPMTICYFSAQYLPTVGGVERYTWNLARCTVAAGHRAIVVTSALPNLPEHEIDGDGIEIYRLPVWPVMNGRFPVIKPGARFHALTAQIWAQKLDFCVVQTRMYTQSVWAARAAKRRGIPMLVIDHSTGYMPMGNGLLGACGRLYEQVACRLVRGTRRAVLWRFRRCLPLAAHLWHYGCRNHAQRH